MARHQPYRIVSVENPAEVHVRDGQLVVIQDKGTASIPIRDIMVLVVCGPNIRMSTMAQTMLAESRTTLLFLGRNHHPSAMTLPLVGNARQARIAQCQAAMPPDLKAELWQAITVRKIQNQARALALLGLEGAEQLWECASQVLPSDADNREGRAAKLYFQYLQPDLNRREEDPLNSALNYGYAIVRAVVAREVVCAGLIPSLGLHHCSQLNPFNLVDDLMEPLRPSIDLLALEVAGKSCRLSPKQRRALREVVRLSTLVDDKPEPVSKAARETVRSFVRCIVHGDATLLRLPVTKAAELLDSVEE